MVAWKYVYIPAGASLVCQGCPNRIEGETEYVQASGIDPRLAGWAAYRFHNRDCFSSATDAALAAYAGDLTPSQEAAKALLEQWGAAARLRPAFSEDEWPPIQQRAHAAVSTLGGGTMKAMQVRSSAGADNLDMVEFQRILSKAGPPYQLEVVLGTQGFNPEYRTKP